MNEYEIGRYLARIGARVQTVVARGVVKRVDDSKKVQRVQVDILDGETEDDVEHFQPWGFSFTPDPTPSTEAMLLAVGAERSHTVAVCVQDGSKRPKSAAPSTGGIYRNSKWVVFVDASSVVHIGAETGAEFIAQAKKTNTQIDDTRKRLDDLTAAVNTLRMDFTTFANTHTHLVATAGSPAAQTGTAFPVTAPVPPVAPIQPPLGASKSVAATKGKVT